MAEQAEQVSARNLASAECWPDCRGGNKICPFVGAVHLSI